MITEISNICTSDTISQMQGIDKTIERISHLVTVSNDTISNELSAVNTLLVVFSIILALVGIGLGIYISVLHHKVSKIKESIDEKEQTVLRLAKTVADTDNKITTNLSDLYKQLQKEETLSLLRRLDEEPLDIANLIKPLLARSLENDGFIILKNAYIKLKNLDKVNINDYKSSYLLLFQQNFLDKSLLDDDLRDDVISDVKYYTLCAFKRDMIKSTKDMCKALSVDSVPFNKTDILVCYLKALNRSPFKDSVELKNILQENLNNNLRVEAIDRCTSDKCYLSMFGVYKPDNSNDDDNNDYTEDE